MAGTKAGAACFRVEPCIKSALQVAADHELRSLSNMRRGSVVSYRQPRQIRVAEGAPKAGFVSREWTKS